MKLAVYSTKQYDKKYLQQVNESFGFELEFFDFLLTEKTAKTANGCEAVCIFVNDDGSRPVLEELKKHGVKYIALRCAGFNNVDLDAAKELGLKVVRVPAYDPEAVAEHAIGMMMTLNRRIHRAYQRTRDANFSLEGTLKPATLETGVEIRVPLFIEEGELVQVDTRDGSYLQRMKE